MNRKLALWLLRLWIVCTAPPGGQGPWRPKDLAIYTRVKGFHCLYCRKWLPLQIGLPSPSLSITESLPPSSLPQAFLSPPPGITGDETRETRLLHPDLFLPTYAIPLSPSVYLRKHSWKQLDEMAWISLCWDRWGAFFSHLSNDRFSFSQVLFENRENRSVTGTKFGTP